jgi:hypothetical protein
VDMSISKTIRRARNAVRQDGIERRKRPFFFSRSGQPVCPAIHSPLAAATGTLDVVTSITGRPCAVAVSHCVPLLFLATALEWHNPAVPPACAGWSPVIAAEFVYSSQCQRCSSPSAFLLLFFPFH